jgi:bifunctional N6-L-threonylcarbamoyladenine synthase / protein kinase Bud32
VKLIAQGAEAKIYESGSKIVKDRIKKGYRLPEIDKKLRRTRTRAEARLIRMASRAGVPVPKILEVDDKQMKLEIENIEGSKVRDVLTPEMCKLIGKELLKLHKANIVHGDLTTSNMILRGKEVVLIDFGLSQYSEKVEDKAVDIHLFKECLKSKHFDIWLSCWKHFLQSYKSKDILKRLEIVERRGKYKH